MIAMKLLEKIKTGVYTIAEMSANHNGDFDRAIAIVRAAKDAGADCLKIRHTPQTR
jgi:sialic acid synthase SpsE